MPKRKSEEQHVVEVSDGELDEVIENMPITDSCDAVRRKIRAFIDSGEMKVGEFQKAIGVSSVNYSRFMNQNGRDKGSGSSTYFLAWQFFKKRQMRGIKAPKKAKTDAAAKEPAVDLSDVQLDGEMEDAVPVYDTCDEIRRKINAYLQKTGMTQAEFLRHVAAQYHTKTIKIQSKVFNDFRSKKGAHAGNTSSVFYGSYVFFEKLRIKEGKPKTKTREEMEKIWRFQGGVETQRRRDHTYAPIGASVREDRHGLIHTTLPRAF